MWKILCILGILLGGTAIAISVVALYKQPPQQQENQATHKKGEQPQLQEEYPKTFWRKLAYWWNHATDTTSFFTGWLAIFSFVLAFVAIAQIILLVRADKTTAIAAHAARESAQIALDTFRIGQRAFVSFKSINGVPVKDAVTKNLLFLNLEAIWSNDGNTPTDQGEAVVNAVWFPGAMPQSYAFENDPSFSKPVMGALFIAPKGQRASSQLPVPATVITDAMNKKLRLYMWGWAEYNDFIPGTPRHRTDFFVELVVNPDASSPYGVRIDTLYQAKRNDAT